jgi:hypothetical protein
VQWFVNWWVSIGLMGQIFALAAIPMTIVMVLQAVLMLIGVGSMGSGEADSGGVGESLDNDGDFDFNADASYEAMVDANSAGVHGVNHDAVKFFTVRGIVAFFALGGWAGLAVLSLGWPDILAIPISLLTGVAAMSLASAVIRLLLRMQQSGNLDYRNAINLEADVYIAIPPARTGFGKVTMTFQERFVEVDAVTDSETAIKAGTKVRVVDMESSTRLVVKEVGFTEH